MFILKKKVLNKILPGYGEIDFYKKNFELLMEENKKLKENNLKIEKENNRLKKLNSFINFQEFLANSYVSPIIEAPFLTQDKRVFSFMDHLSKYLIQKANQIEIKPFVSVIMHTYNNENVIRNAIISVLNQTYENWELLIVNAGGTDNDLDFLKKESNEKIKIISNDKNDSISSSRNIGLKNANGDIVMYLDPYNEWDSRYIETMVGAFIELPDADALYSGQLLYKDYDSKPFAVRFGSFNKSLLHNRNYIDISCLCHKKHLNEKIGGFDENLIKLSEWDYILKISNNFKMYSVPVLLSKYFESSSVDSFANSSTDYYEFASKILEKNHVPLREYENLTHRISIIIPSYESLNELKECIRAILSFDLNDMIDIIVVDNNSSIEVKEYLKKLESNGIKIILNDVNYGFTYAVKQGIESSDENSDILILNNDAILTEGAIEHLQHGAYGYSDCGIIVPHELVSERNHHMRYNVPYADIEFKCDVAPSKEHHNIINMPLFHDGGLLELNFAPFFCVYIKREVYNKTLGLDPELGRHYRSDRIFSDFIRHILKMRIYQEPNAYVYHKHQVATNILSKNKKEYFMMFKKNQWPSDLAKDLGYKKALWD